MKHLRRLFVEEDGQNTVEYLLLVGTFGVLVFAGFMGLFTLVVPQVLKAVCPSVDPLGALGTCIGP